MKRVRFWIRVALMGLRERLVGIRCGCGEHTWLPAVGWRYGTVQDGRSSWECPECLWQGRKPW
jgi:hypothetical protein